MDEEIRSHELLLADEKIRAGMNPQEARRLARLELGGVEQVKESVREIRAGQMLESLFQDVQFGLRMLVKSPGFTLTVILTLALSVGANTAIFSLVNALLLKSLPYSNPERMGTVYTRIAGSKPSDERHNLNGEQWELLRDQVPALISGLSGSTTGVNLQAGLSAQYVHNGRVSAHYFDALALQPILGRNFSEDEDRPHGPRAVILSYELWRNVFGADPNIVGQTILLKSEPHTVVGVLPQGAETPLNADAYTALQPSREGEGGGTNFQVITRLRGSATWQEADAQINRTWSARSVRYELTGNPGAQVTYYSVPLQKGQTDPLRPQVLVLMLSAGFILLIACANLSSALNPVAPLQTEETLYVPAAQLEARLLSVVHVWIQPDWIVRTASTVAGLSSDMRRALATADASLPVSGFYSMKDLLARTLATQRIEMALLGAMAALALLLSAVGVFGLVANMVAQRRREIGIRMALGSSVGQAMLQIGRSGIAAAILGVIFGLVVSAGALRVMRSVVFGVGVYDASTLSTVVLALFLVALMAIVLPTLKIAKIDPARTLREE